MNNAIDFNTPVKFDGDIIITDPCYLMKERDRAKLEYPSWWDYLSKTTTSTAPNGSIRYNHPEPKDYPDARPKTIEDCHGDEMDIRIFKFESRFKTVYYSEQFEAENKAYEDAVNNYHKLEEIYDDWVRCDYGEDLGALGFTTSICTSTIYGDWGCTTFQANDVKEINSTTPTLGKFCADAGKVCVVLLDEVLKYNPDFDYHINRPWTTTLIKDFHGEVSVNTYYAVYKEDGELVEEKEPSAMVVGKGNINFIGTQTGF